MASNPDPSNPNPADVSSNLPGGDASTPSPASRPYRPGHPTVLAEGRRSGNADCAGATWSTTLSCAVREYPLCSLSSAFVCGALVARLLR